VAGRQTATTDHDNPTAGAVTQLEEKKMKKQCAEYGVSEKGNKRCIRFEESGDADVVVAKSNEDTLGYFDIKEVSSALGALGSMGLADIIPPLVGGAGALLTTLLIRKFVKTPDSIIRRFAPVGGILGGVLVSIPLYWAYGKKGVITGALSGALTGGVLLGWEQLKDMAFFSGMGLINVQSTGARRRMLRTGEAVASEVRRLGAVNIPPTARVPGAVSSAMDIPAFAGKASY
jgi:hypothetical protein